MYLKLCPQIYLLILVILNVITKKLSYKQQQFWKFLDHEFCQIYLFIYLPKNSKGAPREPKLQ